MIDDSLHLQENPHLLALLSHYAQQGTEDRATWRDRLMQMEGVEPKQLSTLHGELIVFDWIEQNTGQAISRPDGTLSPSQLTVFFWPQYGLQFFVKGSNRLDLFVVSFKNSAQIVKGLIHMSQRP